MGPIIRVPADVAQRLAEDTDLVEVEPLLPDAVEEPDVELGSPPGVNVLLVETPKEGFGRLVTLIAMSDYAKGLPVPFLLTVRDQDSNPHPFQGTAVNEQSIQDHLRLAYFGERGDRRPLIRA